MLSRVPQKIVYAVMATLELALHYGLPPIQAKMIAKRQGIPNRFIEHILHALKRAGLIESLRGAQGGYVLSRNPAELSLADIVQAMENSPPSNQQGLTSQGNGKTNGFTQPIPDALLTGIWEEVDAAKLAILDAITLQTLTERYRHLEQERAPMYHI